MKFHAQIINSKISFGTEYSRIRFSEWAKNNNYKFITIEPREKITREARGYFEGALCPSYIEWTGKDPNDHNQVATVRELFKLEFNGEVTEGLHGEPVKIAKSTSKMSRDEFRGEFIAKIVEYFDENQIPIPNPELYKAWKNKWSIQEPLLTFWQWRQKHNFRPDMNAEEVKIQEDKIEINYPKEKLTPKF